jgi:putative transcriptional regulator
MAEKKVSNFEQMLLRSADQALAIARGELEPARITVLDARDVAVAPPPSFTAERVQLLRKNLKLSQPVFADLLNVSVSLVRAWERGAREPEGASQRLLQVAEREGGYLVKRLALLQAPPRAAGSVARREPEATRTKVRDGSFTQMRHSDKSLKTSTSRDMRASTKLKSGSHVFTKRSTVHMKKK